MQIMCVMTKLEEWETDSVMWEEGSRGGGSRGVN